MPKYQVHVWRKEQSSEPEVVQMVDATDVDAATEIVMRTHHLRYANAVLAVVEGRSWREASRDEWRWSVRCFVSGKYSARR